MVLVLQLIKICRTRLQAVGHLLGLRANLELFFSAASGNFGGESLQQIQARAIGAATSALPRDPSVTTGVPWRGFRVTVRGGTCTAQ